MLQCTRDVLGEVSRAILPGFLQATHIKAKSGGFLQQLLIGSFIHGPLPAQNP
jgi:hypothetical protein